MDNSNIHPDTSSFRNQNLRGRDFSNWNIQNADFTNAKLEGTDFTNAKLEGANFTNARLEGANFKDADLKKVNFEGIKTGVKTYWAFWSKIISWLLAAIAGGYTGYIGSESTFVFYQTSHRGKIEFGICIIGLISIFTFVYIKHKTRNIEAISRALIAAFSAFIFIARRAQSL